MPTNNFGPGAFGYDPTLPPFGPPITSAQQNVWNTLWHGWEVAQHTPGSTVTNPLDDPRITKRMRKRSFLGNILVTLGIAPAFPPTFPSSDPAGGPPA